MDICWILCAGHRVRMVLGTGDQKQNAAGHSRRAERSEKAEESQHQPHATDGITDWTEERRDCLMTAMTTIITTTMTITMMIRRNSIFYTYMISIYILTDV